jgi:hypothetical protein
MLSPFTDAPANLGETSKKTPLQRFNKKNSNAPLQ